MCHSLGYLYLDVTLALDLGLQVYGKPIVNIFDAKGRLVTGMSQK